MEAFSLLKYWRTTTTTTTTPVSSSSAAATKTIVTTFSSPSSSSSAGEDGPFFDLEFSLPDDEDYDEETSTKMKNDNETETCSDDEEDLLSDNNNNENDNNEELKLKLSPSDELFFKGDLVSIEPNGEQESSKSSVNILKSATKFRVLMLKLKKSKPANAEKPEKSEKNDAKVSSSNKFFTVKFKVEEVPLVSLFTRDNSSKEIGKGASKEGELDTIDERKITKETVQKYLKMVKPFYVRVSKRYVEKLKFSGGGAAAEKGAAAGNVKGRQGNHSNLQAGLKVVRKHLGKSRSASAAVSAAPTGKVAAANRRDDSLVEVQDGIQGAILHCKKSFNASRGN